MAPQQLPFLSVLVVCLLCATCTARDALYSGQRLSPGQSLNQGAYALTMQRDCNLVLYARTAIWSSGTFRKGTNCYAIMQFDGNFVVYSGAGRALWSSRTNIGIGNYILILQPDRNLVVYGPARWSSRTNIDSAGVSHTLPNATAEVDGGQKKP